ncbi:MAG: MarR family winged helix-turn-helix transcriptional regulator, partial [Solirubrobacterales bacterium]
QLGVDAPSATGFEMLVVLTSAGGELELRALRRRLRTSKANATEVLDTLVARGLALRSRHPSDRRAVVVELTEAGRAVVARAFPAHTDRVRQAFDRLEDDEKRQLASICRKLADAA